MGDLVVAITKPEKVGLFQPQV